LVHPAGLPPANSPFEAEDDNNFTTDAEMGPMERLALSWGKTRQFTKLLLSLLSHIGVMMACRAEARTRARMVKPAYMHEASARQPRSRCAASEGWWVATDSHRVLAG
jgi:hypothetical protein